MRDCQKCRGGKCGTLKCGTKMQEWKMRDLKMRHQNAGAENAGPSSMESYLAIKCANGILMLCQPDISFSALSTV